MSGHPTRGKRVCLVYLACLALVVAILGGLLVLLPPGSRLWLRPFEGCILGPLGIIEPYLDFNAAIGVLLTLLVTPLIVAPSFWHRRLAIVVSVIGILIWIALGIGEL